MFVHLHTHSPYSFLDGASDLEPLVQRAAQLGMPALALTDHDNVCAAVKFTHLCRGYHVRPILGAEVTMEDNTHLTLLAQNRDGYGHLCRLLSLAYAHGGRLTPRLPWSALGIEGWEVPVVSRQAAGGRQQDAGNGGPKSEVRSSDSPLHPLTPSPPHVFCLSGCRRGALSWFIRNYRYQEAWNTAVKLKEAFGPDRFFIELQDDFTPDSQRICRELAMLARRLEVGVVATNNVHYATPEGYLAHDMLRCVHARCTLEEHNQERPLNGEQYLKSPREMAELFGWCPEALEGTMRIAEQCQDVLPDPGDITPSYSIPGTHEDAAAYLRYLTIKGGKHRYRGINDKVQARIDHELEVICRLGYADYFLMCWEIARWARKQGIRCTGRGSAADSCVAYCLTLTDVDVIQRHLPFARFLAEGKKPDIDLDFPSDRRDDVFRYIVAKYGEEHTGMVCTFSTYWAKSAVRDLGKVLSIPPEALEWLSDNLSGFIRADRVEEAFGKYAELRPFQHMKDRFKLLFDCAGKIAGFPRHIATHSSGIVISRVPLHGIAPLQPSARGIMQIWELDKDDAETIGAIKLDVLSLRMLSAIGDAERDIARTDPSFAYDRLLLNDPKTYKMIRAGKAVGTFQFESAAQMALAATLQPEHFEDLVAAVALIRPGPIQGHVVNRFVACRNGWMRADILHPCLRQTLAKTYGCIVFQEQVNDVVVAMTGCSDAEADRFRKSITQHTKRGTMEELRAQFVQRSRAYRLDFDEDRANALFDQIQGWAGYGFTEGHAASFALTGYKSAYLSVHHPAEFFAGEMNHQPMGFFNANTLATEARHRGVQILPVDINASRDKCHAAEFSISNFQFSIEETQFQIENRKLKIENPNAIRLGLRLVQGLREEDIQAIEAARMEQGPFVSLLDFCARVPLHRDRLENLILCGAFDLLHEHRRGLLWRLDETLGLAATYRAADTSASGRVDDTAFTESGLSTLDSGICSYDSRLTTHDSALTPSFHFGDARAVQTPVAWDIADFSPWDRFLWTWRIVGVAAEAHVFAHLREELRRYGVTTTYDAQHMRHGTRVTVAGLNIRPHRPRTVSGNPVLFTLIEDETEMLQAVALKEVIWETTSTFLTSPAVFVRGIIERKGRAVMLHIEKAKPLRFQDFLPNERRDLIAAPPADRTYTGTKIHTRELVEV